MTKPLIKLPSVELRETKEALDKTYSELAAKDARIADKDAEIAYLKELLLTQEFWLRRSEPAVLSVFFRQTVRHMRHTNPS